MTDESNGESPKPSEGSAQPDAMDRRLWEIERKLDRLVSLAEACVEDAKRNSAGGHGFGSADRHADRNADRFGGEAIAARVGSSMAGADATVRGWFDRRPFLFVAGLFAAALIVFQIID